MLEWLLDPLQFAFMRDALAMGVVLGVLCAVTGSYLIVQQMSMIGGVISHSIVPGLSIAFFLGIDVGIGAFVAGVLSAICVALLEKRSRLKVDAAMSLTLTTFLAFGILLISLLKTNQVDLSSLLFGDILGVTRGDLGRTIAIAALIITLVKLFYKELLFYSFDPLGAQASGLPVQGLYMGLISAITLTIVATMQVVGVLLVMALLVGPAITAYLLVKELHQMMWVGAVLGAIASISGMYASYYLDLPSGPAIVMAIFAGFLLALCFSPRRGWLSRRGDRSTLPADSGS
ncbi:metal ABC transporter permease [Spirulina major]|uniref:metal ABC transporter permease n=1 Tax=Spirulina major TaxID=270636 RepID=UPI0009348AEF